MLHRLWQATKALISLCALGILYFIATLLGIDIGGFSIDRRSDIWTVSSWERKGGEGGKEY